MSRKISDILTPISNKQQQSESTLKNSVKEKIKKNAENFKDYSYYKIRECSVVIEDCQRKVVKKVIENTKIENFPKIANFNLNQNDVESENVNNSELTDIIFKNTAKYKKFELQTPKYECKYCNKVMNCKKSSLKHFRVMHSKANEDKGHTCKICDTIFKKKIILKRHMTRIHPEGKPRQYECDFDGKVFNSKTSISSHMKMHQTRVKCTICYTEISAQSLTLHMKVTHAERNKFECKICSKSFKSNMYLKNHFRIHDKRSECQICYKKFQTDHYLKLHVMRVHEKLKNFFCEICQKGFNEKFELKLHLRTHEKNHIKKLKCQRCDYATDFLQKLQRHLNFHQRQDEKFAAMKNALKCEKCPTLCRNRASLKEHVKNVHPEEKWQCDLCGNYIKGERHIKNHVLKVHLKIT